MKRNCAFQYAKTDSLGYTDMVENTGLITLEAARKLWSEYYPDCAKHIKKGGTANMVVWVDMNHDAHYHSYHSYIHNNAESDGTKIWETTRHYFDQELDID